MKRFVLALAALSLVGLPACTTSHNNSGMAGLTTNNVTGTVSTTLPVNVDAAYSAAQSAVQQMQYTVKNQSKDANTGVVNAKTADGTAVEVTVRRDGDKQSKLEVNASPLHTDIAKNLAGKIQSMAK